MKIVFLTIFCCITAIAGYGEGVVPLKDPVVYIAGFTDASGSRAWANVETAVRDLLVSAITEKNAVRVVDRDMLDSLLSEQELTLAGLEKSDASAKIGKLLGADRIITGRLITQDETLVVIAHIVDVPTAVIQATCKAQGQIADLLEIVINLATQISRELEIPFDPGVIKNIDVKPVCSLNFLRGLSFYYTGDYNRALFDFMISGDVDPDNYERHYWMARCYIDLEEYQHARVELWHFLKSNPHESRWPEVRQMLDTCEQNLKKNADNETQ